MEKYQLYLENIINALLRAGISFPADFSSYESLWWTSNNLGVFLEMNSLLQKSGSGVVLMGLDESTTFKSYWNSEFYLEYQERKGIESNFTPKTNEVDFGEPVVENPAVNDAVNLVESTENSTSSPSSLVSGLVSRSNPFSLQNNKPKEVYHGIEGVNSDGLDYYGVDLDILSDDEKEENISQEEFHGIEGVNSDGLDDYGVGLDIDESDEDGLDAKEEEPEVEEEIYHSIVGVTSDGFDDYGVALDIEGGDEEEAKEDEENDDFDYSSLISGSSSSYTKEVYHSVKGVNESGLDYYGVDLDIEDENAEAEEDADSSYYGEEDTTSDELSPEDLASLGYSVDDLKEEDELPSELSYLDGEEDDEELPEELAYLDGEEEELPDELDYLEDGDFEESGVSPKDLESNDLEEDYPTYEEFKVEEQEVQESPPEDKQPETRKEIQYPKELESTQNILKFLGGVERRFKERKRR